MLALLDGFDHYLMGAGVGVTGIPVQMAAKGWQRTNTGIGGVAVALVTATGRIDGKAFSYHAGSGGLNGTFSVFKQLTTTLSTITVGFALQMSTISASQVVFQVRTTGAGNIAQIRINADGSVSILNSGGTTIASSAAGLFIAGAWNYIELKLVIAGASGSCEVQINGVNGIATTTGNFGSTNAGVVNMYADRFIMPDNSDMYFDDLYVTDSSSPNAGFMGDVHVYTYFPDADGTYLDFVPNTGSTHYTQVDDNPPDDDTTYVSAASSGDRDSYDYPNVAPGIIKGIQINQYCRKSGSGLSQVKPLVRSGGSDYAGAAQTVVASYFDFTTLYDENPDTSAAWTATEFNAAEFGTEIA